MSQQLGILLMIDSAAAIEAGTLDGNIYLIDNAKWVGSTGEGTGHLVTAINGARVAGQVDVPVLNWLPYGVASPPPTLPQTFFLGDAARETLAQHVRSPEERTALAREQDVVAERRNAAAAAPAAKGDGHFGPRPRRGGPRSPPPRPASELTIPIR